MRLLTTILIAAVLNLQLGIAYAQGVDYDFGSTAKTLTAPSSGTIKQAKTRRDIQAGDLVTAAELAALNQVLTGGRQTIRIDAFGTAVGGRLNLGADLSGDLGSLVIPKGVTAFGDFSKIGTLTAFGNLTNSGKLYAFSTDSKVNTAFIGANNIFNNQGALLSTVLPANNLGLGRTVSGLNLDLNAVNDIINSGVIRSAGSLTLTAGGQIVNALPAGISGPQPILQSFSNLNLNAANIVNSGAIVSNVGNINIVNQLNNILVDNTNGVLSAVKGNINVRDALYTGDKDITVLGGTWLSEQLNLYSGTGAIEGAIGETTGVVSTHAELAHIYSDTPTLYLGESCLLGDPTFVNTGGDIVLSGNLIVGENLAVLAAGDITATSSGQITAIGNDGYNVILVAGAAISLSVAGSGGDNNAGGVTIPPGTATQLSGGRTATVDFTSGTGGDIDLSASTAATVIDTHSTAGTNGSGGDVVLAAFANGSSGGKVLLNQTVGTGGIDTSGIGSGTGGNVSILAGAAPGSASDTVLLNEINAAGGSANLYGDVKVVTAQPTGTGGTNVTFNDVGNISTNGPITNSSTVSSNAKISLAGDVTGDDVTFSSGGDLSLTTNVTADDDLSVTTKNGSITISGALTADDYIFNATGGSIAGTGTLTGNASSFFLTTLTNGFEIDLSNLDGSVILQQVETTQSGASGADITLVATSGNISVSNTIDAGTGALLLKTDAGQISSGIGFTADAGITLDATGGMIYVGPMETDGELKLQTNGFIIEVQGQAEQFASHIIADTTVSGASGADITIRRHGVAIGDLVISKIEAGTGAVDLRNSHGGISIQDNGLIHGNGNVDLRADGGGVTGGSNSLVSSTGELVVVTDDSIIDLRIDIDSQITVESFTDVPGGGDIKLVQTNGDLYIGQVNARDASVEIYTLNGAILNGPIKGDGGITLSARGGGVDTILGFIQSTGHLDVSTDGYVIWLPDTRVDSLSADTTANGAAGANIMIEQTIGSLEVTSVKSGAGSIGITINDGGLSITGPVSGAGFQVWTVGSITGNGLISAAMGLSTSDSEINLTNVQSSQVTASTANTTGGNVTIVQTAGNLVVNSISAGSGAVNLTSDAGDISITSDVTGNGGIVLTATDGGISGSALVKSTGQLNAKTNGYAIDLSNTQVASLSADTTLDGAAGADIDMVRTGGNVTISSVNSGSGDATISTTAGAITVSGAISGDDISLSTNGGSITGSGLIKSTGELSLTTNASPITLSNTQVDSLTVDTTTASGHNVTITQTSGSLTLNSIDTGSWGDFTLDTLAGGITIDGPVNTQIFKIHATGGSIIAPGPISTSYCEIGTNGFSIELTDLNNFTAFGTGTVVIDASTIEGGAAGADITLVTDGNVWTSGIGFVAGAGVLSITTESGSITAGGSALSGINIDATDGSVTFQVYSLGDVNVKTNGYSVELTGSMFGPLLVDTTVGGASGTDVTVTADADSVISKVEAGSGKVEITSSGGISIADGATIHGDDGVSLIGNGGEIIGAATSLVSTGSLDARTEGFSIDLRTNVSSVSLSTINTDGDLGADITLVEIDGDLDVTSATALTGNIDLSTLDGALLVTGEIQGDGGVVLSTTGGSITTQGAGSVNSSGQLAAATNGFTIDLATQVASLSADTTLGAAVGSDIVIAQTGSNLTLASIDAGTGDVDILSNGKITINADISVTSATLTANEFEIAAGGSLLATSGNLNLNGNDGADLIINNAGLIGADAGNVNITSTPDFSGVGGNLTVYGGGTMEALGSGASINLNVIEQGSSANGITFTAGTPGQIFNGVTNFNASGQNQFVSIDPGVTIDGDDSLLTINCCNVTPTTPAQQALQILKPFYLPCDNSGTIAHSDGDLDLDVLFPSGLIQFAALNLTLLASGNITDNGNAVSIDLGNTVGSSGSLTIIAGYNFTPAMTTPNVVPDRGTFVIGSSSNGNINLTSTDVTTIGSTAGGNVLAVANGSIAINSITTAGGTASSGNVTMLAAGTITATNIDTTSTAGGADGDVSLTVSTPVNNSVEIDHGIIASGTFTSGAAAAGDIILDGISTGSGIVSATTSNGAISVDGGVTADGGINFSSTGGTITGGGLIKSTGELSLTTYANEINLSNTQVSSLNVDTTTASGHNVTITQTSGSITLNSIDTGSWGDFTLSTLSGGITIDGPVNTQALEVHAIGGSIVGAGPISAWYSIIGTNGFDIELTDFNNFTAFGTGTVFVDASTTEQGAAGADITLVSGGNVKTHSVGFTAGTGVVSVTTESGFIDLFIGSLGGINLEATDGSVTVSGYSSGDVTVKTNGFSVDLSVQMTGPLFVDTTVGGTNGADVSIDNGSDNLSIEGLAAGTGDVSISGGAVSTINNGVIAGDALNILATGDIAVATSVNSAMASTTGTVSVANDKSLTMVGPNAGTEFRVSAVGDLTFNSTADMPDDVTVLDLQASGGTLTLPVSTISVNTTVGGDGGQINLVGDAIVWSNQGTSALVIDASGSGGGIGGSIQVVTTGDQTIGAGAGGFTLNASGASGGAIGFITDGTLTLDFGSFNASATDLNGDGGSIQIGALNINNAAGGTLVLDVSAAVGGAGNGGSISVALGAGTPVTIDSALNGGDFQLVATGGTLGGDGGSIDFSTFGDLIVNTPGFSVNPLKGSASDGASIRFEAGAGAGSGNLLVNGSLSAAGLGSGVGGDISLISDSTTAFNIGSGATVNGITGTLSAASKTVPGTISVLNYSGDISVISKITAASEISLEADGDVSITGALGSKTTTNIFLASTGSGNIVTTATSSKLTTTSLEAIVNDGSMFGPGGAAMTVNVSELGVIASGTVNIINKGKTGTLLHSSIADTFILNSKGAINAFDFADILFANSVSLTNSSGGIGTTDPLQVDTSNLSINLSKGVANIVNCGCSPLTLMNSSISGTLVLESAGDISVQGAFGNPSKANITITAIGGSILDAGGSVNGLFVNLNSVGGSIGDAQPVIVTATNFSASSDTSINIIDNAKKVVLGDIFANVGDILIGTGSATSSLTVRGTSKSGPAAIIHAEEGSITLQQNNVTKGLIIIGAGSEISTNGIAGGDVNIVIGPVVQISGSQPLNVVPDEQGTGQIFYGANGITAFAPDNFITAKNANVVFSTGELGAKSITLKGATTIIADPPIVNGPAAPDEIFKPVNFGSEYHVHDVRDSEEFIVDTGEYVDEAF